jgi:hypothetical protein
MEEEAALTTQEVEQEEEKAMAAVQLAEELTVEQEVTRIAVQQYAVQYQDKYVADFNANVKDHKPPFTPGQLVTLQLYNPKNNKAIKTSVRGLPRVYCIVLLRAEQSNRYVLYTEYQRILKEHITSVWLEAAPEVQRPVTLRANATELLLNYKRLVHYGAPTFRLSLEELLQLHNGRVNPDVQVSDQRTIVRLKRKQKEMAADSEPVEEKLDSVPAATVPQHVPAVSQTATSTVSESDPAAAKRARTATPTPTPTPAVSQRGRTQRKKMVSDN